MTQTFQNVDQDHWEAMKLAVLQTTGTAIGSDVGMRSTKNNVITWSYDPNTEILQFTVESKSQYNPLADQESARIFTAISGS